MRYLLVVLLLGCTPTIVTKKDLEDCRNICFGAKKIYNLEGNPGSVLEITKFAESLGLELDFLCHSVECVCKGSDVGKFHLRSSCKDWK